MQTQKNYKNVGMQIQVPNNSVEPLNTTFSDSTELSSSCIVNITGMSNLTSGIVDKLESRMTMWRARRFRNTRQRPKRFSVEDVRFNHYNKRWGKHFSTVEIGKNLLYSELRKIGELHLFEGHETKEEREKLGLRKISNKSKRSIESHATDAIALASLVGGLEEVVMYPFSIYPFKKNDVVIFEGELARIGGFMNKGMSLHNYDLDNKRYERNAKADNCIKLFNQKIMFENINGVRFLCGINSAVPSTPASQEV